MMNYKLFGPSGLRVSELALGTMTFGEDWGFGTHADECRAMFDAFTEAGGNFIDTANKYTNGSAERIVGDLIKGARERYVIASKFTLSMRDGDPNGAGNSRKNMMQSVEASLDRLGTDYIDLYWVHAWDFTTSVQEVMRGLDDLVRSGKVLYVGISDAPAWVVSQAQMLAELRGWSPFVGIQIQHNLVERTVERELIPMAESLGLSVAAWAPLASGMLTGKYSRDTGELDSKRASMVQGRLTEKKLEIARTVDAVADELGVSSAQVAINWVRQSSDSTIPLIGARKVEQLVDAMACLEHSLSDEQMQRLDEASDIELGFPHDFLELEYIRESVYGDLDARIQRRR